MKYYVVEIAKGDSKIEGPSISTHDTKNAAIASFHSKLGTAMKSELFNGDLVIVFDELGNLIDRECYIKEVPDE